MPKIWTDTIEDHRRAVREATITAAAALVDQQGLTGVTMSGIAEKTGIGRATLYKYFPDVEAVLIAWHERQISDHLAYLGKVADRTEGPEERLTAVLKAFAMITQHSHDMDLATQLHRGQHIAHAEHHLHRFISGLLTDAANAGSIRNDIAPEELAHYCLHALTAAASLRSKAAVHRLVTVTLAGLHQ